LTRRVVVTGVGLVCALGIGTEETWKNLVAGQSGIGPITHFDATGFDCKFAGEIKNFDPLQWIEKKEVKKMGRFIQVALAGADFAVKMAQWKPEISDLDEVGVYEWSEVEDFVGKYFKGVNAQAVQRRAESAGLILSAARNDRFTVQVNETWARANSQEILKRLG